jgi:hypothetical protein
MDNDGYPEEHELKSVRLWPHECGWRGLMDNVRDLWKYPDYFGGPDEKGMYKLSTGGWSGNEEIIYALQKNTMFWMMCWVSSRRGGHYEFEVKDGGH